MFLSLPHPFCRCPLSPPSSCSHSPCPEVRCVLLNLPPFQSLPASLPLLPIYSFHLSPAPAPTTPSSSSHFFAANRFVLSCPLSICVKGSGCSPSESFPVSSLNNMVLQEFSFNILVSWQLSVCVLVRSIHFVPVAVCCGQ